MKTKKEKIKRSEKPPTKTLPVSDNLQLSKVYVSDIPKDIIFPDELNRFLRDQIQYLNHQNGMLERNLSEVELKLEQNSTKITTLNSELEEYQTACPKNNLLGCTTANFASSKIVELSKKLRERSSEMEVCKTKCSKLEKYIMDFESKKQEVGPKQVVEKPRNELEDQIKSLQEKITTTSTKLFEAKNSNVQLKNDLKMANKLLQQEVGENFDTIQSSNCKGTWRGRAQVIRDLQQKNSEFREKLKGVQDNDKGRNVETSSQVINLTNRLESLIKENGEIKESFQDVKRKFESSKARSRVYESDCSIMRSKINKISEENDDYREAITALTSQVVRSQELQNEAVNQKQVFIQKIENEKKSLQMENAKQLCKIENSQTQIEELRRECDRQKNKNRKSYSPIKEPEIDYKIQVYYEAERLRLLELTRLANERLEIERAAHANIQSKYREQRQKVAKLESKVARLLLDQKTDRSSNYSTLSLRSKEIESSSEDRLELAEETIKALDTRLQIERQERQFDMDKFSQILINSHCNQNPSNQNVI